MGKYLLETTEKYRVDDEGGVALLIDQAKKDSRYELAKYTSTHKERKQKGEVIDDYYVVTLIKKFDNEKEPCGEASVEYKIGAF